jgi:tetratricopeptide (TPR) repeat protein
MIDFNKKFGFKIITGVVLMTMILSIIAPVLLYPKKAEAQWITTDLVAQIQRLWRNIKDELNRVADAVKKQWAAVAYKNALRVLVGELARGTAEWLASGGQEQKPLFITDPYKFWLNAGDQALGVFIEEMTGGTALENLGCEMLPEAKFNLIRGVGSLSRVERKPISTARCPVSMRWRNLRASVENNIFRLIDLLKGLSQSYQQQKQIIQNDNGISQTAKTELLEAVGKFQKAQDRVDNAIAELYAGWGAEMLGADYLSQAINEVDKLIQDFEKIENEIEPNFNLTKECAVVEREKFCENVRCRNYLCLDSSVDENTCKSQSFEFKTKCSDPANKVRIYFGSLIERKTQIVSLLTELKNALNKAVLPPEEMARIDQPEDLILMFTIEGNPIATTLKGFSEAQARRAEEEQKQIIAAQIRTMKGIETLVSQQLKTPPELVEEKAKEPIQKSTKAEETFTGELAADLISIFTSTLAGKLFERWFLKGLNPQTNPETQQAGSGGTWLGGGQQEVKKIFADLATVSFLRGSEAYNIVDEFASCPLDTKFAGPNNCVIDTPFAQAIKQNLTIREAIEKDYLHGNWYVGGYGVNDSARDFSSRYSLTNIKKLRKARIVPLGLEIAAIKISRGDFGDQLFKLADIVEAFDRSDSPFYHLVDPNWVLKAPPMRCELMAYSAVPLPNSSERQTTCLDLQDCIGENQDGSCHTYGYCTREKNIWRMDGNECPFYYNTCQTYTRTRDNQQFSWLKNTLDFTNCDQNNVGCKWYCQNWDASNNSWACSNGPEVKNEKSNVIFFNRLVEKCEPTAEGCSEFIQTKEGLGTNLLPNSSFESVERCDLAEVCQNIDGCDCLINNQFKCKVLRNEISCPILVFGWSVDGGQFVIDQKNTKSGKVVARVNQANGGPVPGLGFRGGGESKLFGLDFITGFSYTISTWVKNNDNNSQTIRLVADYQPGSGQQGTVELYKKELPGRSSWQRLSYTFTYPLQKDGNNLDISTLRWQIVNNTSGGFVYFDDLQLETGPTVSDYADYGNKNLLYLKKAPDWMKCYDNDPGNDSVECQNFVKSCKKD